MLDNFTCDIDDVQINVEFEKVSKTLSTQRPS